MILDSPQFFGLKIYVSEKPVPGSFYSPKSGDTLSHIANWAYGVGALPFVLRINKSAWNNANCVYRKKSTSCTSAKAPTGMGATQSNWGDGAWLALCSGDRQSWATGLGLSFPVIWVPGLSGEEPEDLADEPIVVAPIEPPDDGPVVVIKPPSGGGGVSLIPAIPEDDIPPITVSPIQPGNGNGNWGSTCPWILAGILVIGVGGAIYYAHKQGKHGGRVPAGAYA